MVRGGDLSHKGEKDMEKFDMAEVKKVCGRILKAADKFTTKKVNQYFKDGQKEDFVEFWERALQEFTCPEMEELKKLIGA